MVLEFPIMADYCILYVNDKMIFATHGHTYNKNNMPMLNKGDILIHGHTHIPAWEKLGDNLYFNPGSVSIPKDNTAHGYMTLCDDVILWKDLNGNILHMHTDIDGEK